MGTQRELSNEYQQGLDVSKNLCIIVLWTKVASALEGLIEMKNEKSFQKILLSERYLQDNVVFYRAAGMNGV